MGFEASWPLSVKDYIEIKDTDIENWLITRDTTSNKCLRYVKWEPLK